MSALSTQERWLGRSFVHPAYDLLLIGGGASLIALIALWASGVGVGADSGDAETLSRLAVVLFLANSAHFASSTVRLYTKEASFSRHPLLTMGLPAVFVGILLLCLWQPELVGRHWQALYLTWSPYHYAAQAFGIASLYCTRAGQPLASNERRWLRIVCLLPFFYAFLGSPVTGLGWLLSPAWITSVPGLPQTLGWLQWVLAGASVGGPAVLYLWLQRRAVGPMPLVSLLAVLSNGLWFVVFTYLEAFVWATVFHGLQYLALVLVFHVRERCPGPAPLRAVAGQALGFYAACVVLAYLLFQVTPYAGWALGFGWAESAILVVATINIHHFVVDAFIWRFRPSDSNRRTLDPAPA
ncbi:MAG: hypothetical protein AAF430_16320 [Myxococcota bacterium]